MNASKKLSLALLALLTAACAPKPMVDQTGTMTAEPNAATAQISTESTDSATPAAVETMGKTAAVKGNHSATSVGSWELSGAMAARSKSKAWSASVNWLQRGASSYQIRLFGPLGSGTVMIEKNGSMVTYRDGPKTVTSSSADSMLRKETGVGLPVANLYYWVRGLPAPGAIQSEKRDANNNLSVLRQSGYTIQYNGYTSAGGVVLPSQIRLQGNGLFIKMVIRRWKV